MQLLPAEKASWSHCSANVLINVTRCGSRILSFGPSFWVRKLWTQWNSCMSNFIGTILLPGPRARSGVLEAFLIFNVQIYAFYHILETPFLPFLISSSEQKTDINSRFYCTSTNFEIVLCYYTLCKFALFNLYEKVIPSIIWLKKVCRAKWS